MKWGLWHTRQNNSRIVVEGLMEESISIFWEHLEEVHLNSMGVRIVR